MLAAANVDWTLPLQIIGLSVISGLIYWFLTGGRPYAGIPLITLDDTKQSLFLPWQNPYFFKATEHHAKGRQLGNGIYQVRAGLGYKIIMPRTYAHEIRNNENLDFGTKLDREFHTHIPGFDGIKEGARQDGLFVEVVKTKLTQSLGLVTDDVVDESDFAVDLALGKSQEWTTFPIKTLTLDMVARISTRVFAGKELARNEDYLHIAKENTVDTFTAANMLHMCPRLLRPVVHWFLPACKNLRTQVRNARTLLRPAVHQAFEQHRDGSGEGKKSLNAFKWLLDLQKGRPLEMENMVAAQLNLSLAAVHTTTETACRVLMQVSETPEIVQPLRDEMIRVLREDGWAKTSLYKMKLLDSFLKEVQRMHPLGQTLMSRYVKTETRLADGTVLPAGSIVEIDADAGSDPLVHPEPEKFDAYRFLKLREQPGNESKHQFVVTSPDSLNFGHGKHACPGRFFASNEIKILCCFLLLQYDWRYEPGYQAPADTIFESVVSIAPGLQMQAKRRAEEIDLRQPKVDI